MMDQELVKRLLATFLGEAQEHLGTISAHLIELEGTQDEVRSSELLEVAYRCTHSLKGGARIVNLTLVEMLCQTLEECFAAVRKNRVRIDRRLHDLMHDTTGIIEKILSSATPESPPTALKSQALQLRKRLEEAARQPGDAATEPKNRTGGENGGASGNAVVTGAAAAQSEAAAPGVMQHNRVTPHSSSVETVKVPAARLDSLLIQAEELTVLKLALHQNGVALKEIMDGLALIRRTCETGRSWTKEDITELDRTLGVTAKKLQSLKKSSEEEYHLAAGMVENLIQDAKSLIMFSFSFLTEGFPKLVREMAREQGKEVKLFLNGETVELDRRILQELKDPLVHMVRNCIDHGIETPEERLAAGKSGHARIQVGISIIENGKAQLLVQDDGRGIDTAAIISSAVHKGIITREHAETINETEAIQLIFHSGLSSRHVVSAISGRGIGMAIVKERVQLLGGTLSVESSKGQGTSFTMIIPLTLASFRGIQIRVGTRFFAVPTLNVQRVCRLPEAEFKTVGNRKTIVLEGRTIPAVPLADILGIPAERPHAAELQTLMILGTGEDQVAFELDAVIGEDDMLVKKLGPQLARVRNISGATVLGDGTVIPIINANDLLDSAGGGHAVIRAERPAIESSPIHARTAKRIMVVDDSITSRTLLKNVLESYGYEVRTACDGLDTLALFQEEDQFDLATVDIEMPRMDGFELTARLRADDRFSRLPVVLITSLDSAEDKKKGIDAGADAYIVKSSFDQSNLLDIIRKLT